MKKTLLTLATVLLLAACKKDNGPVLQAGFTFNGSPANELLLGTNDATELRATINTASTISWDLGDGRTSAKNNVELSYAKAGTYTVNFTAQSNTGQIVTVSKKVTVLDRVLKSIVIDKVYWNTTDAQFAQAGWPLTNTADIYVRIQQLQGNDTYNGGFAPNAPVIYESAVVKNVSSSSTTPITLTVPQKLVLDKLVLDNRMYLISLVAKNAAGEYMLVSNRYSGANQVVKKEDIAQNTSIVNVSLFSSMNLVFDFE